MSFRLAALNLLLASSLAPRAFAQAMAPEAAAPAPAAAPTVAASTPTPRNMQPTMPNSPVRFPAAADWKNYGVALSSVAVEDLGTLAKLWSGKAKAGEDKLSLPGMALHETLLMSSVAVDKAGARKVVLDAVFQGLKKPGEDIRAAQKNVTRFFEDRSAFGSGTLPLSALERYKALLAQKSDGGLEDSSRVVLSASLVEYTVKVPRMPEEQKALDAFFARAIASVKDQGAALQKK